MGESWVFIYLHPSLHKIKKTFLNIAFPSRLLLSAVLPQSSGKPISPDQDRFRIISRNLWMWFLPGSKNEVKFPKIPPNLNFGWIRRFFSSSGRTSGSKSPDNWGRISSSPHVSCMSKYFTIVSTKTSQQYNDQWRWNVSSYNVVNCNFDSLWWRRYRLNSYITYAPIYHANLHHIVGYQCRLQSERNTYHMEKGTAAVHILSVWITYWMEYT